MSNQGFIETLRSLIADQANISNTVAETILVPDYIFPVDYFSQGRTIRCVLSGKCSNVVTTPGTVTFRVRIGTGAGVAVTTWVAATAAVSLDTTAHTDFGWRAEFGFVCRSAGSAGTGILFGEVQMANKLATFTDILIPQVAAQGTLNTAIANTLAISAQFSVATSPTNIMCQMQTIESMN